MKRAVLLVTLMVIVLNAKTLTVPGDHSTIQSAINASVHGDTVLVYPGTYFENINFKGKNIVVTSRFCENGDITFIATTVINGSQPRHPDTASCVLIVSGENSSAVLQGFTLTGGKGTRWTDEHGAGVYREGGGVLVTLSSPVIRHNYIVNNEIFNGATVISTGGGGIRIGDGGGIVENNVITLNKALYGGGIVLNYCSGTIVRNNIIVENSVKNYIANKPTFGGGGIWANTQKPGDPSPNIIENNTIYGNRALDVSSGRGGGILFYAGANAIVRNNIIWENQSAAPVSGLTNDGGNVVAQYNDVMGGYPGTGNISVDPQFADTSFILKSNSLCVDAGDSSGHYNDPQYGINPELTIYPSRGTTRNDMGAYGGPRSSHFGPFARPSLFLPLTSVNFGNHLPIDSAGVFSYLSFVNIGSKQVKVDSVRFMSTTSFSINLPSPELINTGSSVMAQLTWKPTKQIRYSDTMLVYHNSTHSQNPLTIALRGNAIPTPVMNVNLTEHNFGTLDINTPQKDTMVFVYNHGTGTDSIAISVNATGVNPSTAVLAFPDQFLLMPGDSQAVTFIVYPQQIIKSFLSIYAPKIRFKSYRGEDTATVEKTMRFRLTGTLSVENSSTVPQKYSLEQNYPNPFNPATTIAFSIAETGPVRLKIYDMLGRQVAMIVNELLEPGSYRISYEASRLSSGVYIYSLQAGTFIASKKFSVIK